MERRQLRVNDFLFRCKAQCQWLPTHHQVCPFVVDVGLDTPEAGVLDDAVTTIDCSVGHAREFVSLFSSSSLRQGTPGPGYHRTHR